MHVRPFRFIHASDFHLETPLHGIAEVPDHLRESAVDAAYSAARKVFDAVVSHDAAFLVLAGDILDPRMTGPRGPAFLSEQFDRLAKRGVSVYWAGGPSDSTETWPSAFPLPANVYLFSHERTTDFVQLRKDAPLARVIGTSSSEHRSPHPGDFEPDPNGLFSIGIAHGEIEAPMLQGRGIHYWALGGRHDRETLCTSPFLAHYSGSPQGRSADETGPHGCTLVEVDELGQAHPTFLPTDSIRWIDERLVVEESFGREHLEAMLRHRVQTLLEGAPRIDMFVSWEIVSGGALFSGLQQERFRNELLDWLRIEYGLTSPGTWSVSVEVESSDVLPVESYDQETILGDFLRAIRHCDENSSEPLELEHYLADPHKAGILGPAAILDKASRHRALHEVAVLGMELLGGDKEHVGHIP